jgi:hypothetical protein
MYRVSINETLGTMLFSISVRCVPSGTVTNNRFNVVVYRVQICTECMRQKHLVQCSFLPSVYFLPSVLLMEHLV